MADASARHIVDEERLDPASYLTIREGDRVYDLYGWQAGTVVEPRIAPVREQVFDGIVVDLAGGRVFVDAPEVRAVYAGAVILAATAADLARAADPGAPRGWPGGPGQAPGRNPSALPAPQDAIALLGSLSRLYAADRLSLGELEHAVERALAARTCAALDEVALEALGTPAVEHLRGRA